MPTYKRPALLMRCLKALLRQKFNANEFEVIVVSDGPDPQTQSMMKRLRAAGRQLKFFVLPEKKGPAAARNLGWLSTCGQIIAFTDDDCIPNPNWLNAIYTNLNPALPEALAGKVVVPVSSKPTDYEPNTAGLEAAGFVTANCACTRLALLKTGGFDERFCLAWREDSDLEFKLITQKINIKRVADAVVVHPVREAQWGVSLKEQKKTKYNALLYGRYPKLYRNKIQSAPPILYYGIVAGFILFVLGAMFSIPPLLKTGLVLWPALTVCFIIKRLYGARLTPAHIAEMVVTSIFIPFLSLYWQWYGAIKYRVFFV